MPGMRPTAMTCFQEIFLEIWRALPAFRGESSQRTWVYRIAHNVALTWQGRDTRSRPRRQPLDEARTHAADPTDLRRILLLEMISRLPPLDRQLVTLWLEGLSLKEIEKLVGIRAGTAAVRLTRVRQQLSRNVNATPGDTQWMNSNHPRN